MTIFERFERTLQQSTDLPSSLRAGEIGKGIEIKTPFGDKPLIYADYVASGRALRQVEELILGEVLPFYANSHTEQSYCGATMTQMRAEARAVIAKKCGANTTDHAVIFGGSGATTGINQLVHLFEVSKRPATVLVGPYVHHSNLLPWRESGADIVEIAEAHAGGVDLDDLKHALSHVPKGHQIVGAFSAMSNVTGVCTDPAPVSRLIKDAGGRVIWDYAGGGPYLEMSMSPDEVDLDAIIFSPHKFLGGPGASGVLVVRREAVKSRIPARPGGGTVVFVNEQTHDYVELIEQREEGGTPNVIGDIRAALALIVKDGVGTDWIEARNKELARRAFEAWGDVHEIGLLAAQHRNRVPILSFAPHTPAGERIDYRDFTRALSDHYGIQARGGCSCAGPYVHRLLNISDAESAVLRSELLANRTEGKPGFVRLNLSPMMSEDHIAKILAAIPDLITKFADQGTVSAA